VFLVDVIRVNGGSKQASPCKAGAKGSDEQHAAGRSYIDCHISGYSGIALEPTSGTQKEDILSVIDSLGAVEAQQGRRIQTHTL